MMTIVVIFNLDARHTVEDEVKAYEQLATVGLVRVQQNARLPRMTAMGTWHSATPIQTIRDTLGTLLNDAGIQWSHLLVVESASSAWYGPKARS